MNREELLETRAPAVSFDVFDTALTRVTGEPRGVFCLLQQKLAGREDIPPALRDDFARARSEAEREARRRSAREEVTLGEIYDVLAEIRGLEPQARERLIEAELACERESARPVPETAAAIGRLRAAGKRILFISDMYLPGPFIFGLLLEKGLARQGDALYASSEVFRTKSSGGLFRHVLEAEGLAPGDLLHVGDNAASDIAAARRLGIRAVRFSACRLNRYETAFAAHDGPGLPGQLIAGASRLARLGGSRPSPREETLRATGASLVGPLLLGYLVWVFARARERGLRRLYFISRDGQVLLETAKLLSPRCGPGMELRYLYGSRQAWHLPAAAGKDVRECGWLFEADPVLTLRILALRAGLAPDAAGEELRERAGARAPLDRPLTPGEIEHIRAALPGSRFAALMGQQAGTARDAALAYFAQEGLLDGTPSGIVDLGWKGRLQDSLKTILRGSGRDVPLQGFYFGLVRKGAGNDKHAFFFDPGTPPAPLYAGRRFANLMEIFTAADHGTTESYRRDGEGKWGPRLREGTNAAALAWGLDALREGISGFVRAFPADRLKDVEGDLDACRDMLRSAVERFLNAPARAEAEAVGDFRHSGDQAEACLRTFAPALEPLEAVKYSLADWHGKVGRSFWIEGSRARSGPLARAVLHPLVQNVCSRLFAFRI